MAGQEGQTAVPIWISQVVGKIPSDLTEQKKMFEKLNKTALVQLALEAASRIQQDEASRVKRWSRRKATPTRLPLEMS
jgi:hypothetical protein